VVVPAPRGSTIVGRKESADEILAPSLQPFPDAAMIGAWVPARIAVKVRSIPAPRSRAIRSRLKIV
jgi:hypothetical protein